MCVTWGVHRYCFSFKFNREGGSKLVVWSRIPVLLLHRTTTSIVFFYVWGVVSFFGGGLFVRGTHHLFVIISCTTHRVIQHLVVSSIEYIS